MAIQKTQGFVLRREDIRETSILLTAYTLDFGKIKLISKGVRSPDQRFISAYEIFALCDLVFYEKKKSDFFFLSQCELIEFFPKVRESLEKLSYAVYFSELLNSVTPMGEANRDLYRLMLDCLSLISGKASPKRVARIFEIKLLSILGFMPSITQCVGCGSAYEKKIARFSISSGGVLCEKCFNKDKAARGVLAGSINFISHIESMPFDRVKNIKVARRVGSEVERLLKDFINYHLDIRLRSMEFIRKAGI